MPDKMRTLHVSFVLMGCLCYLYVPSCHTSPLFGPSLHRDTSAVSDGDSYRLVEKRGDGVDAWSICPPHMSDVDCFYAYLRVYARLRKAAEESDRVSMRNIGKRSFLTSSPESDRARSRSRMLELCPDDMSPALCYQTAKTLYTKVLARLRSAVDLN